MHARGHTHTLSFLLLPCRRVPVLDVAGPHLPPAFPLLRPCESFCLWVRLSGMTPGLGTGDLWGFPPSQGICLHYLGRGTHPYKCHPSLAPHNDTCNARASQLPGGSEGFLTACGHSTGWAISLRERWKASGSPRDPISSGSRTCCV